MGWLILRNICMLLHRAYATADGCFLILHHQNWNLKKKESTGEREREGIGEGTSFQFHGLTYFLS